MADERLAERAAQAVGTQVEASRVPAAAWAVVDGDRVVVGARGDGVDGDTPFVLGSVSKSFTALAVAQLVDHGLVRLDAPVTDYLPDFATATPGAVITVRQLLGQTNGLPTSAGLALLERPQESLQERVRGASGVALEAAPGAEFHYCNLNYAVLGLVVQRVSGVPFGAYVQREIYDPLGMDHSHASLPDARADGLEAGSTPWFGLDVTTGPGSVPGGLPDGYLVSTARDMARYLRFQLGDGTAGGTRVVSAEGLRLMHARQTGTPPDVAAAGTDAYGFGWALGSVRGRPLLAHDGDVPGYHATAALLPADDRALAVLVGRGGFLADADAGYRAGLDVLAGGPGSPVSRAFQHGAVVVAAVAAGVVALLLATSLRRWRRLRARDATSRSVRRAAARDLLGAAAVPLVVFGGAGLALQGSALSPRIAFGSAPDVTALVLVTAAALVVRAFVTLGWGTPARSR